MSVKLVYREYKSALSTYINGLVSEKRELGYIYNNESKILKHLDSYWIENEFPDEEITQERLSGWCRKTSTEGNKSLSNRIVATRQLVIYMRSLGHEAYMPECNVHIEKPLIHVLSSAELKDFFHQIDLYSPQNNNPGLIRFSKAYRVHFRLILCLGLRRTESCMIRTADYDCEEGTLKIIEAKNDKHRIIHLTDELKQMLDNHIREITLDLGYEPEWLFPGYDPVNPINSSTLSSRFNDAWNKTTFAGKVDKKPTVHSLRHTFVVLRIRQWELKGQNVNELMPYLSRHLGHISLDDTYYYYQRIQESLEHIRRKDTVANAVLPEVLTR